MSRAVRAGVAVAALAVLGALIVWAVSDLRGVGHPPGVNSARVAPILAHERQAANAVNGVTFDMRGSDTLGEEMILFAAALGVSVLLRAARDPREVQVAAEDDVNRRGAISGALRASAATLVGPMIVFGLYVVTHGQLTPGGGFQGGVILAAALLLTYAGGQVLAVQRTDPVALVEVSEAVGALAFALVALGGVVFAGVLMANFLPFGEIGALLSSGTIALLSVVTGVEVTAALALILTEFLDQTLLRDA